MQNRVNNARQAKPGGGGREPPLSRMPKVKRLCAKYAILHLLSQYTLIANAQDVTPQLNGLSFPETLLGSGGITRASMAGGAEIIFNGQGFSHSPAEHSVVFSVPSSGFKMSGPQISQDDQFKSSTDLGKLQYTTPSAMSLHGKTYEDLAPFDAISYDLSLVSMDEMSMEGMRYFQCQTGSSGNCRIIMSRDYTPVMYYIQPQVVYYGSDISFYVDPKKAQDVIAKGTEMPFQDARIDGFTVDFEGFVDDTYVLAGNSRQQIRGKVGKVDPTASATLNMKFKVGNTLSNEHTILTCDYSNTTCYKAKVLPTVSSIDVSSGYATGGQTLNIKGYGFHKGQVDVKVDGVSCEILGKEAESLTCVTGAQANPSTGSLFVGQPGLRRKIFKTTYGLSFASLSTDLNFTLKLSTSLEPPQNFKNPFYGNLYTGFFKAPASANYRFYMSCDDSCSLDLSNITMDPTKKRNLLTLSSYTAYRGYLTLEGSRQTEWVNLTEGEYYFLEVRHIQYAGGDHLTVSVEIEDDNIVPGHFHTFKEVQRLQVNQEVVRERSQVIITKPDAGTFVINIQNPLNNKLWTSKAISTSATGGEFANAIAGFYSSVWGASISVFRTMYDQTDSIVTDVNLSVKSVYEIVVHKSLSQTSTNYASFARVSTQATFEMKYPTDVQLSTPPISGSFLITCTLPNGDLSQTLEIGVRNETWRIRDQINLACPNYKEKFDIWEGPRYASTFDGRDILLRFVGTSKDVPQFIISDNPANPVVANNLNFNSSTEIEYNPKRIFYEPIPYEFLHVDDSSPRVSVTVDGLEAACDSLNCGYEYVQPQAQITEFSLSGTTLTISGSQLPTLIQSLMFANQECSIQTQSASEIVCFIPSIISGLWSPLLKDSFGLIPIASGSPINIPITITQVTPNTGLNLMGGNTLEISASNLPSSLGSNLLRITLSGSSEDCTVLSISSSKVVCLTGSFNSGTTSSTLTLNINGVSATASLTIGAGGVIAVSELVPMLASPVLKSNLTIKVDNFPDALKKSDLSASLVLSTDPTKVRPLNIIEIDDVNKKLILRYGGAPSGLYNLKLTSQLYGNFDASSLTFQAIGKVTDFQPRTGSLNGGTLVTITGYNFSTDIMDNNVRIGYTDCLVESSSNNEINCRTLPRMEGEVGADDVVVLLKVSEEAVCELTPCKFTWRDDNLPTLTSYQTSFDGQDWILTLAGSGFGDSTHGIELIIDGHSQTVISVSDSEVTVKLTEVDSDLSRNVKFYTGLGSVEGSQLFLTNGVKLTPKLLQVQPNEGSSGGSYLYATVIGAGVKSQGITLVDQTGNDICSEVKILKYNLLRCKTKTGSFTQQLIRVKQAGDTPQDCVGSSEICSYKTLITMPQVVSLTKSSDSLTLTGTGLNNLPVSFNPQVSYAGVSASSVTITSDTSLTAFWDSGLPLSTLALAPVLSFTDPSTNHTHWAPLTSTLANPLPTTLPAISPTQCSFAGGCLLTLPLPGLSSNLLSTTKTSVKVCGRTCQVDKDTSESANARCWLPEVPTIYSQREYGIGQQEAYLKGEAQFASKTQLAQLVWDGSNQRGWTDNTANCFFGAQFRAGYVGVLTEVKYFMTRFIRANFVGKLFFQGSNDGTSYTTVFTVGNEIHEGWNYITFESGKEPRYQYYRFFGSGTGSCVVGEINFRGTEVIDSNLSTYSSCPIELSLNGESPITLSNTAVTYSSAETPVLDAITPRFGTVKGNEILTFTGKNFVADTSLYTILIDGKLCQVQSATQTSVSCKTSSRPGLYPEPSLEIRISGMGRVATRDLVFRYVSYWSDETTWGGEFQPVEGDMVYVPAGLHLFVDVDSTPVLSALLVEGSLIFAPHLTDPSYQRYFDAHYIMVRDGYMEVGTEKFPYTSKLTITMHSNKYSPEIPIYGNKVIGVRNGILDLHGAPRDPVWTELDSTVTPGSSQITIIRSVDWKVGEKIAIASTSYDSEEAEERTITAVNNADPSKPILTLDQPLNYKHFSEKQIFGTEFIEMRAEVGLLSRNVVYRGDPETSSMNQFGAHIMIHSKGDESVIGRIENIELRDVGQAFQLGRYPIHFHMIGTVHKSYVRHNSIHHTYNRAVTIHGVHYLRVINNFAFHTMGHTFFIEDAAETKNLIEHNLAMKTMQSFSLLITDQTPASFWITHPDNIFRGNHAAGSIRYGFWFDTKPFPMGPSFDPNVCPENSQLGEFSNNVAHSNGRYGLRLFHNLIPRQRPCDPIQYDPMNKTDPYWKNPLVTAEFINFTSYKNGRNGAIAERVGDVRWLNFKVSDNLVAGLEFSLTGDTFDATAQINGALVVGYSNNADSTTMSTFSHGVIPARKEYFEVHNVKFYNFNVAGKAALGSCSHCFHPASTDSGARTTTFSKLYFDPATVTTKIRYQFPFRDIFHDLDGTLTGLGPKSWATPYWEHNRQPECQVDQEVYDGILCKPTAQLRRLVFEKYATSIFENMDMKILKIDGTEWDQSAPQAKIDYFNTTENYAVVPFKPKLDPANAWAIPFVTGHTYKIHWQYGLDFEKFQITRSQKWLETDKNVLLVFNFTDVREKVEVMAGGEIIENKTLISKAASKWETGDNVIYNDTAVREIHLNVNGKNASRSIIKMVGYRCVGSCLKGIQDMPLETTTRLWSDPDSWDSGQVPKEGENVVILSGRNFVYDLEESPMYNYIEVNGQVTFKPDAETLHLRAKYLFVRAGRVAIGTPDEPHMGNVQITLSGEKDNKQIAYTNAIEGGNKVLANTGIVEMYGQRRDSHSRLRKTVQKGDFTITVGTGLDWRAGDQIGLFPTNMRMWESDTATIKSYDKATGQASLEKPLEFYHYGAETVGKYSGVDMRGEVTMLSRNVRIVGNDTEAWGCQVVTSDFLEENGVWREGQLILDSVEVYNCSQFDTFKAALRFEGALNKWSHISNSAIHHGLGIATQILASANVRLSNNTMYDFKRYGINVQASSNVTITANLVGTIRSRGYKVLDGVVDVTAGILGCAREASGTCPDLSISHNIVAGVDTTAYSVPAHRCGDARTQRVFFNNTAHSILGTGAVIFIDPTQDDQKECFEASFFNAYKIGNGAIVTNQATKKAIFSNLILIDNTLGAAVNVGKEGNELWAHVRDSVFYGESEIPDCDVQNYCQKPGRMRELCLERSAMIISQFTRSGKPPLIKSEMDLPYHEIMADASWGGRSLYENLTFSGYRGQKTWCGQDQRVIRLNPTGADYHPRAKFLNTRLDNIDQDTLAYLFSPQPGWANLDDCGDFPCTAPNNALIQFEKTTYTGAIRPFRQDSSFQLIANNKGNSDKFDGCRLISQWNAYYCTNENLGILIFESLDDDSWKRMVSPIFVESLNTSAVNKLNTFMDHIWDGFYTGQLRMARWPAIVQTGNNYMYNVNYTGTAPQKQRFMLNADSGSVIVRIRYTKPGAYVIKNQQGGLIKANEWDTAIKAPGEIKGDRARSPSCGENRYRGVVNILEFYIRPGCQLTVEPIDSIYAAVRMNWTMEGFFAKGGTTYFVDRLAASLGIHASNIKIVSVYQGSVVVQFQIFNNTAFPLPKGGLSGVESLLKQIISKVDLGAPVIGVDIKTTSANIITDPLNQTTFDPFPTTLPSQEVPTLPTIPTKQNTSTPVIVVPITIIQEKEQLVKDGSQVMGIVAACIVCAILLLAGLGYALYRLRSKRTEEADLSEQHHQSKGQLQAESQLSSDANQLQFDGDYEKQYHPNPSEMISDLMKNRRNHSNTSSFNDQRAKIHAADNTNIVIEEGQDECESSPDKRSRDNIGSFEVIKDDLSLSARPDHGVLPEMFTNVNENKMKDDTPLKEAKVQQPPILSNESPIPELVLKPRRLPTIKISPNIKATKKDSPNK